MGKDGREGGSEMKVHCIEPNVKRLSLCGSIEDWRFPHFTERQWIQVSKEKRCKNCQRVRDARLSDPKRKRVEE